MLKGSMLSWPRLAVLAVVCTLPSCNYPDGILPDLGGDASLTGLTLPDPDRPCALEPVSWPMSFTPVFVELTVGATVTASLTSLPDIAPNCRSHVASVEWTANVPGILSIALTEEPTEVVLTAVGPGTTPLQARVTHVSGRIITSEPPPPRSLIVVVPASGS